MSCWRVWLKKISDEAKLLARRSQALTPAMLAQGFRKFVEAFKRSSKIAHAAFSDR
jgi:hypothetical protein